MPNRRARVHTGGYRSPHLPQISPARPQQFFGTATGFADAPIESRDSRLGVERPRRNDPHKDRNHDNTAETESGQEQGKNCSAPFCWKRCRPSCYFLCSSKTKRFIAQAEETRTTHTPHLLLCTINMPPLGLQTCEHEVRSPYLVAAPSLLWTILVHTAAAGGFTSHRFVEAKLA